MDNNYIMFKDVPIGSIIIMGNYHYIKLNQIQVKFIDDLNGNVFTFRLTRLIHKSKIKLKLVNTPKD